MNEKDIKHIVEAILITASEPVHESVLRKSMQMTGAVSPEQIASALRQLQIDYGERAFELVSLASGWQIMTKEAYAPWINNFQAEKPPKYSAATMETLAIIAYKQPVTRADIESIRGVSVSSLIMKSLIDRQWIKVGGHRDTPGKPALYVTTPQFLDYFKLSSLTSLPMIEGLHQDEEDIEEFSV